MFFKVEFPSILCHLTQKSIGTKRVRTALRKLEINLKVSNSTLISCSKSGKIGRVEKLKLSVNVVIKISRSFPSRLNMKFLVKVAKSEKCAPFMCEKIVWWCHGRNDFLSMNNNKKKWNSNNRLAKRHCSSSTLLKTEKIETRSTPVIRLKPSSKSRLWEFPLKTITVTRCNVMYAVKWFENLPGLESLEFSMCHRTNLRVAIIHVIAHGWRFSIATDTTILLVLDSVKY